MFLRFFKPLADAPEGGGAPDPKATPPANETEIAELKARLATLEQQAKEAKANLAAKPKEEKKPKAERDPEISSVSESTVAALNEQIVALRRELAEARGASAAKGGSGLFDFF